MTPTRECALNPSNFSTSRHFRPCCNARDQSFQLCHLCSRSPISEVSSAGPYPEPRFTTGARPSSAPSSYLHPPISPSSYSSAAPPFPPPPIIPTPHYPPTPPPPL